MCLAKVNIPPNKERKLVIKTIECIFIGYLLHNTTYRFFVIYSKVNEISNNTIMESSDANFFENVFPLKDKMTKIVYDTSNFCLPSNGNVICDGSSSVFTSRENANKIIQNEPRKSKRKRKAKDFGPGFYSFMFEDDPKTFGEAMRSIDAPFWKEAINNEMNSLKENKTWFLTDLPPGCRSIGCKWIFRKKLRTDGSVDKFKARLVVIGCQQVEGVDFFDTYSPVSKITTIRVLIVVTCIFNLQIRQMDVKTAFLNGDLEEEIYMKQPEGFIKSGKENKVCKLVKSLYGLKQAPKQ